MFHKNILLVYNIATSHRFHSIFKSFLLNSNVIPTSGLRSSGKVLTVKLD